MSQSLVEQFIDVIRRQDSLEIVDEIELPARPARMAPVPIRLHETIKAHIRATHPDGLYCHQAEAIDAILDGHDVCLATATASGKSLVFLAAAAHLLQSNAEARILALYPARALIQDQLTKWDAVLRPLGLRATFIDGSVPTDMRAQLLRTHRAVLMTPDVAHAWLLSHLGQRETAALVRGLRLLILDESHVYDGVFGTNMAYFLRRLEAVSRRYQVICSTATIGEPHDFMKQLLGRTPRIWGADQDGATSPAKTLLVARSTDDKHFDNLAGLLSDLSQWQHGPFLAFADSRKMVERLVAATTRRQSADAADDDTETTDDEDTEAADHHILPYRAGYEAEDRTHIHEALREGTLAGVVSTSALELGIDIGEISLAILLNSPPSVKSFWQRVGRAGRRQHGICLIIDDQALIDTDKGGLAAYIARSLEPNWLYLDNRYLQYANALCAALEVSDIAADQSSFGTLPTAFREFLDNEINPTQNVPPDLYVLKQRAQSEPHLEFPIRTGLEREFQITGPFMRLGRLTLSQLLREAYPGAVYYYLGRPYRVFRLQLGKGEAFAKREKTLTTKPIAQTMVFPDFKYGLLSLRSSTFGFLAEVHLQVSEIVRGLVEYRGMTKQEHRYGPDSEYYSRDLNRFFQTTGVCWYVPDRSALAEPTAQALLETFCTEYAVQSRDLGVGPFMTTTPPVGPERCQGICIYDSTYGSLRLTQRFAEQFERVLELSLNQALTREQHDLHRALNNLRSYVSDLRAATVTSELPHATAPDDPNWTQIIAPGATAMYMDAAGAREVEVVTVRYTPQGLMYELQHDNREVKWMTPVTTLQPLHGRTQFALFHLLTGEIRPLDEQAAS